MSATSSHDDQGTSQSDVRVDREGAARFFGIGLSQFNEWLSKGRVPCKGDWVSLPGGGRGRVWKMSDLEAARREMANPDGWIGGEAAREMFGIARRTWSTWLSEGRLPAARIGHSANGKRINLYSLDELQRVKSAMDELDAANRLAFEPHPDPDRPGAWRVRIFSEKYDGKHAIIDEADVALVRGKRLNWSGASDSHPEKGSVVFCSAGGRQLSRAILGIEGNDDLLPHHLNGDRCDCRRSNLATRSRRESSLARRNVDKFGEGFKPYVDPADPTVARVPVRTHLHRGMEAIIDAADLPLVQDKRWNWVPRVPGSATDGSVVLLVPGSPKPSLTRIVLGIDDPEKLVSHRSGNRLDCRRANLVVRTREQVSRSRRKRLERAGRRVSSQFKGVHRKEGDCKWSATIVVLGKTRSVGRFRSEIDAALAYDGAARELFGEHARLNLPDPVEAARLRAEEVIPEPGPFPPPGWIDRHEACAMFGLSINAWMAWERRGKITCGKYHRLPGDRPGKCKLYPKAELEETRVAIDKLGKPYPDPDRPGVWRVPLSGWLAYREALVDEADLHVVQGRKWNWSERRDSRQSEGAVVLSNAATPTSRARQPTLHRLILGLDDASQRVTFANNDALDCRRANLIVRSHAEVNHTQGKVEMRNGQTCTSRFKGVSYDRKRECWIAQIGCDGVHRHIGRFNDEAAAAEAYDDCARELFGPHAYLNFPDRESSEHNKLWAQRILDGSAKRERRRLRQIKKLERLLRRAKRDLLNALSQSVKRPADAGPTLRAKTTRKRFGVDRETWKRWRQMKLTPDRLMIDGKTRYRQRDVERLLHACGLQPTCADAPLRAAA